MSNYADPWIIAAHGYFCLCGYSEFTRSPIWDWGSYRRAILFKTAEEAQTEANRLNEIVPLKCVIKQVNPPPPPEPTKERVYLGPPKRLPKIVTSRVRKWHRR